MRRWAFLCIAMMVGTSCASISTAEREQLKRELIDEVRAENAAATVAADPVATPVASGAVEGRVLRGGQPLPGCKVRIVRLEVRRGPFGSANVPIANLDGETGPDGYYRFDPVPSGAYKIKWAPPGAERWIRMLSPEPDFAVETGKTTRFRDIESARRALGN